MQLLVSLHPADRGGQLYWLLLPLQKTGYHALHLAALKGSQPVVQALLLGGANVDVRAKVSIGLLMSAGTAFWQGAWQL